MTKSRLLHFVLTNWILCALGLCCGVLPVRAANIVWNTTNGSWSVATNWLPTKVPGSGDVAIISAAGSYDVTISANVTVNAINLGSSGSPRLHVNNATLTTSTGIAVGSSSVLDLDSGTLSGGAVSLNGKLSSTGTSNVNVALTTAMASTIEVGAGSLTVANGFTNRGLLSYPASGTRNFYVTNGTLINASTGTISCATTGLLGAVLDNQGSITSTGGQGFLTLGKSGATHTNSGSMSATAGAYLVLNGFGDTFNTSGSLSADAQSILRISSGVFNQTAGTISGSGNFELIATTSATFASNPTSAVLYLAGGGIVFPSPLVNGPSQEIRFGPDADVSAPQLTNQVGHTLSFSGLAATIHATTFTNLGNLGFPRHLVLDGNLNLGPLSHLYMEAMGLQQGVRYTWLDVSGAVQAAGSLSIQTSDLFLTPMPGQTFDLITAADRSGNFDQIDVESVYFPPDFYFVMDPATTSSSTHPYRVRIVRQKWTPLTTSGTAPVPRRGQSAVYAPSSGSMVVFGGENGSGQMLNDVWVLNHADGVSGSPAWVKLNPTGTPPVPRKDHSAVYDVGNNRMTVFGGETDSSAYVSDIWVLTDADGSAGTSAWVPFPALPGVAPRSGSAVGYNPVSNRMVMSQGGEHCWPAYGDMWVLKDANGLGTAGWTGWSIPGTPPSIRRDASFAYDPIRNRLLIYGGRTPCGAVQTDAFVLSNADGTPNNYTAWSPLANAASPSLPGQAGAQAAYDPYYDRLVTFGGLEVDGTTLSSGVFYMGSTGGNAGWTQLPLPSVRPSARAFHSMAYSVSAKRWIVFGGDANGTLMNDVWTLELEGDAPEVSGIGSGGGGSQKPRVLAFSASPNPNPSSHGMYFSVKALENTDARIAIYDALGRRVAELHDGPITEGEHRFAWTGNVASGIYFVLAKSGSTEDVRRVVVTR